MSAAGGLELRPYQIDGVEQLRAEFRAGHRLVAYVLPTGAGKTVVFVHILRSAVGRGRRVGVVVHRQELVDQAAGAVAAAGVAYGVMAPGYQPTAAPVQICSVATLARHLADHAFDLLILDECHHAAAATWLKVLDASPAAKVLGVTASPLRLDGAPLGDVFETMVIGPGVAELTRLGYLARAVVYAPPRGPDLSGIRVKRGDFETSSLEIAMLDGALIGDAVGEYRRLAAGLPSIAFCCSIRHSEAVGAALGLDVPGVAAVLLLRPTRSLGMHMQMIGRALRPAPGKTAIMIDCAGNTLRHGLPEADHTWSLHGCGAVDAKPPALRRCRCGALAPAATRTCRQCGEAFPTRSREPQQVPGHLVEFAGDPLLQQLRDWSYGRALGWADDDRDRLALVARARGYAPGWVWHRLRERQPAT